MYEFIIRYWLEFLFGLCVAALTAACRNLQKKLKKKTEEQDAIKQALLAILHDRLFQECRYYLEKEYIPLDESEKIMDNMKIMYESYKAIGGNGTGTELYNRFKSLPLKP